MFAFVHAPHLVGEYGGEMSHCRGKMLAHSQSVVIITSTYLLLFLGAPSARLSVSLLRTLGTVSARVRVKSR